MGQGQSCDLDSGPNLNPSSTPPTTAGSTTVPDYRLRYETNRETRTRRWFVGNDRILEEEELSTMETDDIGGEFAIPIKHKNIEILFPHVRPSSHFSYSWPGQ